MAVPGICPAPHEGRSPIPTRSGARKYPCVVNRRSSLGDGDNPLGSGVPVIPAVSPAVVPASGGGSGVSPSWAGGAAAAVPGPALGPLVGGGAAGVGDGEAVVP